MTKKEMILALKHGYKLLVKHTNGKGDDIVIVSYNLKLSKEFLSDSGVRFDMSTLTTFKVSILQNPPRLLPIGTKVKIFNWALDEDTEYNKDIFEILGVYKNQFYKLDSDNFSYIGHNEVYPIFEEKPIKIDQENKNECFWWYAENDSPTGTINKVYNLRKTDVKLTKKRARELFGENLIGKVK